MSTYQLKILAIVTMLLDHITMLFVPQSSPFYFIGRGIGRIAFPIFCFLLVEGFHHTKDVMKYLKRLLIFAVISELPYDLANYRPAYWILHQNVFFTLFIGLAVMICCDNITAKYQDSVKKTVLWYIIFIAVGCVAATCLGSDYGYLGILYIACFFFFYQMKKPLAIAFLAINVIFAQGLQLFCVFALVFILLYNEKLGKKCQYFFYAFYPCHLLVLGGLVYLLCAIA